MRNTLETRLGVFFALTFVAAILVLEMAGGLEFFKGGRKMHAFFNDIQELKIGDPVKMAGVQIGRVEKVGFDDGKVKVTLKVNPDAAIRTSSKATIKFTGLMGQNFVAIDFGVPGSPQAEEGATLAVVEQADFGQLMAKLDNVASGIENVTKSFTGEKIDNLLGPITDFVRLNTPALTATIGNMKVVSDRVVKGEGTIGRLINEDTLYYSALNTVSNLQNTLDHSAGELSLAIQDARDLVGVAKSTIEGINAGQGTLGKLAKDDKLYTETTEAMSNMKEIMQKINRGQGSVGKLINDESLLKNVKLSLQKLDKATEGLEDTGPLSVLGTAVNSLF